MTGRTAWPSTPFNEGAVIVGRSGGKSRTLATIAVYLACIRDYAPYLAPGEVATIAVIAADRDQARAIFHFVSGLLKAVPLLRKMVVNANRQRIELSNRVADRNRHGVVPDHPRLHLRRGAGRRGGVLALRRELGQSRHGNHAGDAARTGDHSRRMLLMAEPPYAKRGELYTSFRRHFGKDDARVLVWKASTLAMHPTLDKRIVDEAYESRSRGGAGRVWGRVSRRPG